MFIIHHIAKMTEEKKIILEKIDVLISKKKVELLKEFPSIHEVDDGIIVRFFTKWDNCINNEKIKFKKIININDSGETVVFFYFPQGAYFGFKKRSFIKCITCLNGKIKINFRDKIMVLESFNKVCLEDDEFEGVALENTYLITTNKR